MGRIRAPWGLYKRVYPDGKHVWWYYIWGPDGVRHRCSTGQVIKSRALGEVSRRLIEGTALPAKAEAKTGTVDSWIAKIWNWEGDYVKGRLKRGQLSQKYVKGMGSKLKRYVSPTLGKLQLSDVTVGQLDKLVLDLSDKMPTSSVNLVYFAAKTIWDEAFRVGDLQEELFNRLRPMSVDNKVRAVLSTEQALSFLKRDWWESDMAHAHNLVAATTGARKSEICALRVGDVLEDRIHIKATVRALEGLVEDTKTGDKGKRWSAIPPAVFKALKPFLTRPAGAFLFETTPGEPTSTHYSMRVLEDAMATYNHAHPREHLPRLVFHSWRHFVVSTLSAKCRPDAVSLHVGHAIPGVKGAYVHQTEEHIHECLGVLTAVFW
jgi:integrase